MAGSLVEFDEKGDGLARYRYVVKKNTNLKMLGHMETRWEALLLNDPPPTIFTTLNKRRKRKK